MVSLSSLSPRSIHHKPSSEKELDFAAMDAFMDDILAAIREHGARAVRVFPPRSQVILLFSERLANEVVSSHFLCSSSVSMLIFTVIFAFAFVSSRFYRVLTRCHLGFASLRLTRCR